MEQNKIGVIKWTWSYRFYNNHKVKVRYLHKDYTVHGHDHKNVDIYTYKWHIYKGIAMKKRYDHWNSEAVVGHIRCMLVGNQCILETLKEL